jgi:hypothetical protein
MGDCDTSPPLGSHASCRRLTSPRAYLRPSTVQHGISHRSSIEPEPSGTEMQVRTVTAILLAGLVVS